jgi:hypothetical protein
MSARLIGATALALILAAASGPAHAGPLTSADEIVGTGGDVTATYIGSSAADLDQVGLVTNAGLSMFFTNQGLTAIGATVDLGIFAAGQVIEFAMENLSTGFTFFEGAGSSNPDGDIHMLVTENFAAIVGMCDGGTCFSPQSLAVVAALPVGTTFVGVEDLAASEDSDFDYNDIVFAVQGGEDPPVLAEPSTVAMLLSGLASVGLLARAKTSPAGRDRRRRRFQPLRA